MEIGKGIAEGFNCLFWCVGILLVLFIATGSYTVYDLIRGPSNKIESKTVITPEIKLTTDGKIVDTVYVYRRPK